MQRLIDAWAGVEESVIQNVTDHRRTQKPQKDIMNNMNIHCDKN